MSIKKEFSKYAKYYDNHNIIQKIVSKALIRECKNKPKKILELGCGSGQVFRYIDWDIEYYKAIDFSKEMCKLHPKSKNVVVKCFDFDSDKFFEDIKNDKYDIVVSSSALQWSKNLPKLLSRLSKVSKNISAALFTSNTFKSIYNITKKSSPILNTKEIKEAFLTQYNDIKFEIINYNLIFENKKELFRYIKNSGVRGEINLTYKEAKYLYKNYNLDYLEFEVLFIKT